MPLKYHAYVLGGYEVGGTSKDLYERKSSSLERIKKWARLKKIYKGSLIVFSDVEYKGQSMIWS